MDLVLDRGYLRLGRWYGAMAAGGTLRLLGGCTAALACGPQAPFAWSGAYLGGAGDQKKRRTMAALACWRLT